MIYTKIFTSLKFRFHQIPTRVKYFFYKSFALLIIWKLIYVSFLLPLRILDKPLTKIVANSAVEVINEIEDSNKYSSKLIKAHVLRDNEGVWVNQAAIYYKQDKILAIEDHCNGLEIFILYMGFIICLPATFKRKAIFISLGLLMIFLVNVLRCVGLFYIIQNYPQYTTFSHHYLFTFFVYAFVIWLWLMFSKKLTIENEKN